MRPADDTPAARMRRNLPWRAVTDAIAGPVLSGRAGLRWWVALRGRPRPRAGDVVGIVGLFTQGIGIWGVNTTVVWGYAIANYVWWIAIGSGGTLISSILVLTRQDWRRSINRFAETMTLFAVAIAGPVPDPASRAGRNTSTGSRPTPTLWACGRSGAARWSGISGPSSATCCSRSCSSTSAFCPTSRRCATAHARGRRALAYGVLALGWRGSARQWRAPRPPPDPGGHRGAAGRLGPFHRRPGFRREPDARLAGEHLPALFRLGALFSGFAMVLLLSLLVRWGMGWSR